MTFDETLQNLEERLLATEVGQNFIHSNIVMESTGDEFEGIELDDLVMDAKASARILMLMKDSVVSIEERNAPPTEDNDFAPPGFYFTSTHPFIEPLETPLGTSPGHSVAILIGPENEGGLYYNEIFIDAIFPKKDAPKRLGTVGFALAAIEAYRQKFKEISLLAGGGAPAFAEKWTPQGMIGYCFWPKMGFDAPIDECEIKSEPHLSKCTKVSEICSIDPEWWEKTGGNGRVMKFSLASPSKSWDTFISYIGRWLESVEPENET